MMLFFSMIYYLVIICSCHLFIKLFRNNKIYFCIIIYYHSLPRNKLHKFIRQIDYLKSVTAPVKLEFLEKKNKRGIRYSIVTFDDAFQSVITNGVPELIKRSIPFTIFIPSGQFGQEPKWLLNTGDKDENEIIATVDDLLKLPSEFVTFGSHTVTHPFLTELDEERAYHEIISSKQDLEKYFKKEIKYLAFPYGAYNQKVLDFCKEAGYKKVFSINYESPYRECSKYEIGRVSIELSDWMIEFKLKVLGAYAWMYYASILKRKLKNLVLSVL